MIKAILFDLDDTLFDHRNSSKFALTRLKNAYPCFDTVTIGDMEKKHLELLEDIHIKKVLTGLISVSAARIERMRGLFKLAGLSPDEKQLETAAGIYRESYNKSWLPAEGSIELLRELKKNYKIGIISNNLLEEQQRKIIRCGFSELVDEVVVSDEYKINKPDIRLFHILLNKLNVKPDEAVLVGDAWETDIIGAYNAGIRAVWYNRFNLQCPNTLICKILTSFIPADEAFKIILSE